MGRSKTHYDVGLAWAEVGETERALAAFRRDLEGATTSEARVEDLLEMALLLGKAGEHEAALRELDACDEELDGARLWWVEETRAEVLVAVDRRREAIAVLETRPPADGWFRDAKTQIRLGELWLEEREAERARAAYEAALAHYEGHETKISDRYDTRVGLVRVLWLERGPEEALTALDRLLEPDDAHRYWYNEEAAWRLRAEILLELGKPWSAAASVRRAFEVEHRYRKPSEVEVAGHRSKLASLHLDANRPDLAYSGFEAAYRAFTRELGPYSSQTLVAAHNLGVACLDLGDTEEAMIWLKLAVTGHEIAAGDRQDRGHSHLLLARAEKRAGLHDEAAGSFATALDLLVELDDEELGDIDRARMYRDAARAFLDVGMCDRALATIELTNETLVDLTGNQARLDQLRRCWDGNPAR